MKNLITNEYFKIWKSMLDIYIDAEFASLEKKEFNPHSFTFYTSVSAISSSKIEGEQLKYGKSRPFLLMLPQSLIFEK